MTYEKLEKIMDITASWGPLDDPDEWPEVLAAYIIARYPMERDGQTMGYPGEYQAADALARALAIILDTDEKIADFDKWCRDWIDESRNG